MQEIVDTDILWKMMDNLLGYPHFPHHLDNSYGVTHSINNTAAISITRFNKKGEIRGERAKFQGIRQECRL
jgi:hypothetical protein